VEEFGKGATSVARSLNLLDALTQTTRTTSLFPQLRILARRIVHALLFVLLFDVGMQSDFTINSILGGRTHPDLRFLRTLRFRVALRKRHAADGKLSAVKRFDIGDTLASLAAVLACPRFVTCCHTRQSVFDNPFITAALELILVEHNNMRYMLTHRSYPLDQ
jgi:hypothetical protein